MDRKSVRPTDCVRRVVDEYGNLLYKLCFVMLGNEADCQDVIQETVIKYFYKAPEFNDGEHEKAWLVRVATNNCKDILRARKRHSYIDIEQVYDFPAEIKDNGITEALMALPEIYRLVLILHYVEDYNTKEISQIIEKSQSAVKMRLKKGRELLERKYREEYM